MKPKTLGWICLLVGIPSFVSFFIFGHPEFAFWFSNHSFIIIGLALVFGSRFWVMAELCLGFAPELFWNIDYLSRILAGKYLWGFTGYMFTDTGGFAWNHLYSLQHLFFIPVSVWALFLVRGSVKRAYFGSFLHGIIIWSFSFIFVGKNINCVYESCLAFSIHYYVIVWPVVVMAFAFFSYLIIGKIFSLFGRTLN